MDGIIDVYKRYKHLDVVLSECEDYQDFRHHILCELWGAIKGEVEKGVCQAAKDAAGHPLS